jgi:hypothetical protein
MKKAVRRASPAPLKWLLLCFPYGLYLMWRGSWHMAAKLCVSALFAAAALGILLFPAPERAAATKVVLVGAKPEAEVFGPALPAGYDPADYYVGALDRPTVADTAEDDTVYVYASASAGSTYYHTALCKYAYASAKRMTLYEAYMLGYRTPCERCNPPVYIPEGN